MKVCGKKDIHVPGCDDCQELEERVDAVEKCCDDAHDEIDTLNTGKADKEYVDDSIENVNQTIVDVADTLGERIDNIITSSEPSVTTLWEGVMESIGDSANLSEDVNDFDYLDIYYRTSVDESEGYYNTVRIPADQFANYTITVGGTLSPLGESPNITQYLTQLSFVDDTATIDNIREWAWNGSQSSDASDDPQALTGVTIYRIDGVKETGGNLEIADARIGVDGTVYPSLGDAIRGQIQDTRDMIPQLVKTVNGNPIVIDDAFGEVKNLNVELLPIQDLHGYSKPWAGGAGNNIFDQSVRRMPINLPSGTTLYIKHNAAGTYGLYGLDENETSVELSMMSPNTLYTVTLDRNITLLAISQGFLDDLVQNNATLMVSKSTITTIEPYSNICPITGHDSVTVGVTGKNLFDKDNIVQVASDAQQTMRYGQTFGAGTYTVKAQAHTATSYIYAKIKYADNTYSAQEYIATNSSANTKTFMVADGQTLVVYDASAHNETEAKAVFTACLIQVEYGSQATSYEPYKSQSKTVPLPHTVYGAGVGVTSGESKETWANIPSYNGETITEPWLSSMDEYVQGATPTTGAQVTYKLATPTDLSTTPTDISLYNGDNVISSDGDMELTYVQDMAIVIRKIEAQI